MSYPLAFLFLCLTVHLGGTTYYLDKTGGDDNNTGETPGNAWENLSKVAASSPAPGDTFLLKRGEVWDSVRWYIQFSGSALDPIVFGAYGNPGDPLPVISSIGQIPGLDTMANWTEDSPDVWRISLDATPGRLFLDSTEVLRASTLAELGVADSEGAIGTWFWNSGDKSLYLIADENPAGKYGTIAGSLHFISVQIAISDHLVFQDLDMRGGTGAAFSASGSTNITVKRCSLGRHGNSGVRLIDILLEGVRHTTSEVTIRNNTLDSDFTFFYGSGSERGCGDGVRMFHGVHNCAVFENTLINWAHNAIELLANVDTAVGVYNNQFYDNYITAPDIPYAHPLGMDGFLDKCRDNEFYRNFIDSCRTTSQVNGNNNWVHHNVIVGMRNSPNKVDGTAFAFAMGIYGSGLVSQDNRFDHNLIIDTDEAAFQIRSFGLPGTVKDHLIRNNIIYETGQDPDDDRYAVGTGIELYDPDVTGVGGNTFQNNLFYNSLSDSNFVFVRDSSTHYSVSEFNALNGVDTNTISGNIFGDPLFTDLANGDYRPQQGSPAIDAGLDLGYALDYDQMPRLEGVAPDMGPYETNYPDPCVPIEGDSLISDPMVLAAMDSIMSGTYSSLDTLDLTGGTVYADDSVVMRAREQLIFRPGFSVEAGASFTARVADLCDPVALLVVEEPAQVPEPQTRLASRPSLRVAPNPATSHIQVNFTLTEEGPVRLTLINLQGQTVQRVYEAARQAAGEYQLEIPLGQQRAGLYVLMLEHDGERVVQRVVVQRE